jgi:hypothetical protein
MIRMRVGYDDPGYWLTKGFNAGAERVGARDQEVSVHDDEGRLPLQDEGIDKKSLR